MAARITRAKKRIVGAGIPFAVPGRRRAARPARHRRADGLPRLHRRLRPRHRPRPAARRPVRRGDPAGRASCSACAPTSRRWSRCSPSCCSSTRGATPASATAGWCCSPTRTAAAGTTTRSPRPCGCSAAPVLTGPLTPLAASYALQARIAAEHATAPTADDTRWDRIVGLYDLLLQVAPSPSARLARAVAVAEDRGAAAGLAALEGLEIPSSHRPAAVRAELLARSGDADAARAAYDQAIAACRNDVERAFLGRAARGAGRLGLGDLLLLGQHGQALVHDEAAGAVLLLVDADPRTRAAR